MSPMSLPFPKHILIFLALITYSLIGAEVHAQRLEINIGGADFRPYPIAAPAIQFIDKKWTLNVDLVKIWNW